MARLCAYATVFCLMFSLILARPAVACKWPASGTSYLPNNPTAGQWQFGQQSQGGNYYYGVAGTLTDTFPPTPVDGQTWDQPQHTNFQLGSVDVRAGSGTPGWLYTGWAVGTIGTLNYSQPQIFGEYQSLGSGGSLVQTAGGLSHSSDTFEVVLTGAVGSNWRYDAYVVNYGVNPPAWQLVTTNYATLTTSTTEQQVFGEVTDKIRTSGGRQLAEGTCNTQAVPQASGVNAYSSGQLLVTPTGTWQDWSPASGRYADVTPGNFSPYVQSWPIPYTDEFVGGPRP